MIISSPRPLGRCYQAGFTILELTIVLVVIGLLVGGVLAGAHLIKGAEINALISNFTEQRTAFNVFREKYGCIPGDCIKATRYFEDTANGDGNGLIFCRYEASAPWCKATIAEHTEAYKQLEQAGLIALDRSDGNEYAKAGLRNCKLIFYTEEGVYNLYNGPTAVYLRAFQPLNYAPWIDDCMIPLEASAVDSKMDDGSASTGIMYGRRYNDAEPYTDCNDQNYNAGTKPKSDYNIENDDIACSLFLLP